MSFCENAKIHLHQSFGLHMWQRLGFFAGEVDEGVMSPVPVEFSRRLEAEPDVESS